MSSNRHLVEGEFFDIVDKENTVRIEISDEETNAKYKKGEIRIVTEQARYPLDTIEGMLDSGKYNRNPEYQRRKRWDNIKKSRLIESLIMNVPIPPIFLYEVDYSIYEVMDGQQRLTAIYDFYKGQYGLEGLEYWKELDGKNYQNLPEQVKKGVDRRYLSSIVLLQETAKNDQEAESLKQIVFERLNSGGEKLTPQETRNALYNGKFNQLCMNLAKNNFFRKMWKMPLEEEGEEKLLESEPYRKMEDVALVLRFFAYRHIEQFKGMKIEKFLDDYLKHANTFSDTTIKILGDLFNNIIETIYYIFGDSAFFLPPKKGGRKLPTKTIYDPMMQAFGRNTDYQNNLKSNAEKIKNEIYKNLELFKLPSKEKDIELFDGRYNNPNNVIDRIIFYNNFLQNYIS